MRRVLQCSTMILAESVFRAVLPCQEMPQPLPDRSYALVPVPNPATARRSIFRLFARLNFAIGPRHDNLVSKPNHPLAGRVFFCFECVLYHGRYEKAQFRFSDEAWASIEPHLPGNQPVARRVEDRRVILGILHVLKVGFGWCDCPAEQGPSSTSLQSVQSLVTARFPAQAAGWAD